MCLIHVKSNAIFTQQYLNKGHREGTEPCDCPDPTKPSAKTGALAGQWKRHHDDMKAVAKRLDPNLDIVFLGDSIIEHFSGTAGMGAQVVSGHKAAFDRRFAKNKGGRMEGKAFGTEKDSVSLLFVCMCVCVCLEMVWEFCLRLFVLT